MNISNPDHPEKMISFLLSQICQPARIQILLIIGEQEACVCHIEVITGMRQASISQHLMSLRKAGLVTTYRDGRHIFYRLAHPEIIDLLQKTAQITGVSPDSLRDFSIRPVPGCSCPQCNPEIDPKMTCQITRTTKLS